MRRERLVWIVAALLFFGAVFLAVRMPASDGKPYSSYSAKPDGTKAAYLLLEDLGFNVKRNTSSEWRGDGVLVALGSDYLIDSGGALILPGDYRFTNSRIRNNADEFVAQMWPYHGSTIVFQEYGRSHYPQTSRAKEDMSLWSILPAWMRTALLGIGLAAFFLMFFYGQRLGEPLLLEKLTARKPLEGVYAMAMALEKTSTYKECASYYYKYCARYGAPWDKDGYLAAAVDRLSSEGAASKLVSEIDKRKKEERYEST
ncbi:MAG: DUF4350 domain-containing protein [Clostridiales bacterium]|nr:DUF4350 domain-containing protein [Clostridiales bacterium]